ncbi:hypothetical protein TNCV_2932721 [Trichonephila clavipes]|nr:hypothetical protein TNCV_2932721 [Trichonephila clavipes]
MKLPYLSSGFCDPLFASRRRCYVGRHPARNFSIQWVRSTIREVETPSCVVDTFPDTSHRAEGEDNGDSVQQMNCENTGGN